MVVPCDQPLGLALLVADQFETAQFDGGTELLQLGDKLRIRLHPHDTRAAFLLLFAQRQALRLTGVVRRRHPNPWQVIQRLLRAWTRSSVRPASSAVRYASCDVT